MTTNTKRLRKSEEDSMLFGVAGGLAECFDVDPTLMRAAWIVFVLASAGTALIAYIVLAIIMPRQEPVHSQTAQAASESVEEPAEDASQPTPRKDETGSWKARRNLFGVALVAVGVLFLLSNLGLLFWWRWDVLWPLALIAIGAALIVGRFTGSSDD